MFAKSLTAFALAGGLLLAAAAPALSCCGTCGSEPKEGACGGACAPDAAPSPAEAAKPAKAEISTEVLAALMRAGVSMTLLDARAGAADDGRRLPGAKSLSPAASAEEAAALISSKDTLVVTYCAGVKCPASRKLAARLREMGYKNVLEYPQGIEGWVGSGHEAGPARKAP